MPPVAQVASASSMDRQSVVPSIGELATTWAETAPGPSLVKVKVRVVRFGSTAESTTRFRKVTVALGAVWVGRADGVVGRLLDTDPDPDGPALGEDSSES